MAFQQRTSWAEELKGHLQRKHHHRLSEWLAPQIQNLCWDSNPAMWLMSLAEDTCDAGHVHHDIAIWLLGEYELSTVMVREEHYDMPANDVETTFDMSVAHLPYDVITGVQLLTINHPDGMIGEVALAILMANPGMTGHTEPLPYPDPDVAMVGFTLAPATVAITGSPDKLDQYREFRNQLLANRRACMGFARHRSPEERHDD